MLCQPEQIKTHHINNKTFNAVFLLNLSIFSSILTRDSDPSFKLVSNAGRVFTSIAKISEKFEENALRIYDFSARLSKFPEDLRLTLLNTWRIQAQIVTSGNWDLRKTNSPPVFM